MQRQNIIDLSLIELEKFCLELGLKPFKAKQIWNWIYCFGKTNFQEMTNLDKKTRKLLEDCSFVYRPRINNVHISKDDTIKWLLELDDKSLIETVFIPQGKRGTICISSQVGCTLNCTFCNTGTQKLVRNLTTYEILGQIFTVIDHLKDWPMSKTNRKVTNLVMMGMGEPLLNYENVKKALKIVMSSNGLCISKRRITMSTSGIVPMIEECGKDLDVNLAISLHAVNDKLRDKLVPINKKYNISTLIQACKKYPSLSNSRRITWEYVMLKDVNDRKEDAINLLSLIKGIPSKINLIPFNPWPGTFYETSTSEQIKLFSNIIMKAGYPTPIRTTRGDDILAACGQLKSKTEKLKKSLLSSVH